jgi:hypothetical protein
MVVWRYLHEQNVMHRLYTVHLQLTMSKFSSFTDVVGFFMHMTL